MSLKYVYVTENGERPATMNEIFIHGGVETVLANFEPNFYTNMVDNKIFWNAVYRIMTEGYNFDNLNGDANTWDKRLKKAGLTPLHLIIWYNVSIE